MRSSHGPEACATGGEAVARGPAGGAAQLVLAVWCGALFVYGLNAGPLYRTEALRAIIGAECLRGHWLYPVLYGEPFLTKPPGHYAAVGLCGLPFGEVTAATARVPSAVAAAAAVFLMFGLFRRTLGDRAALLAGLLVPTSVLWLDKAPSAEIDMTLVGWVTAALVLFHRYLESQAQGRPSLGLLVLALLCVAGGTLTKWTAPAFFYLTAVPLLAWRGRLGLLFGWRHLLAVAVAAGACAGWAAAVAHQVGWETLAETVRSEAAYRFRPGPKAHGYPWGDVARYPAVVLAAHLPLSVFALTTLRPGFAARWDDRGRLLLQFLHCWTWPNLLFWTLVPNHNVRYALPLSPGLMGLGVMGLLAWGSRAPKSAGLVFCPSPLAGEGGPGSAGPGEGTSSRHPDVPSPGSQSLIALSRKGRGEQPVPPAAPGSRFNWLLPLFLALWLAAKVVFVEVVIPKRTAGRDAAATAAELRAAVPPGETLHLFRLKDEGVMFDYGRPARRCHDPNALPRPCYAVLIGPEWDDRAALGDVELLKSLRDQQGDPLILVRLK